MAAYHTLGALQLPRGMVWSDELSWIATQRNVERSITGALLWDVGVLQAGRPITLVGEADAGWIPRSTVIALLALADTEPETPLTFVHADGRIFAVRFAPDETPITAEPIPGARPELPPATFPYVATVRLITV